MEQPQNIATFPQLQPGDHICCARKNGLYDHHGIYVGDDMVIHIRGAAKKLGPLPPCEKCGNKRVINGEIAKTCINCFLYDHSPPWVYDYGVPYDTFKKRRRGTCTYLDSRPAHEVIKTATDILEGKLWFGPYNILTNNCEHFAVYCKTGRTAESQQVIDAGDRLSEGLDAIGKAALYTGMIVSAAAAGVVGVVGFVAAIINTKKRPKE